MFFRGMVIRPTIDSASTSTPLRELVLPGDNRDFSDICSVSISQFSSYNCNSLHFSVTITQLIFLLPAMHTSLWSFLKNAHRWKLHVGSSFRNLVVYKWIEAPDSQPTVQDLWPFEECPASSTCGKYFPSWLSSVNDVNSHDQVFRDVS